VAELQAAVPLPGLRVYPAALETDDLRITVSDLDLIVEAERGPNGVVLLLRFNNDRFDGHTADALLGELAQLLRQIGADARSPLNAPEGVGRPLSPQMRQSVAPKEVS
jgi:hypothetical protein